MIWHDIELEPAPYDTAVWLAYGMSGDCNSGSVVLAIQSFLSKTWRPLGDPEIELHRPTAWAVLDVPPLPRRAWVDMSPVSRSE